MIAGGLPGPAPTSALFTDHFTHASKDFTNGVPSNLLSPFVHDINVQTNNTATNALRDHIAVAGHNRYHAAATIIIYAGAAQTYLFPHRWGGGFSPPIPTLDGKFFACHGELASKTSGMLLLSNFQRVYLIYTSVLRAGHQNLPCSQPHSPMDGSTSPTGDAGTSTMKTRKIVTFPHKIVGQFLAQGRG